MRSFSRRKTIISWILVFSILIQFILPMNQLALANSSEETNVNNQEVELLGEQNSDKEVENTTVETSAEDIVETNKEESEQIKESILDSNGEVEEKTDIKPSSETGNKDNSTNQSLRTVDREISVQEASDFLYEEIEGGVRITGWKGTGTEVVIPDEINGMPVLAISRGQNSFQNRGITKLILGKNVKEIGPYSFADNSISELVIPDDSELLSIGEYAFLDNLLPSFTMPKKLVSIDKGAFSNNKLTSLIFNETIQSIGEVAFRENNLSSVEIGNSVTSFGARVFVDNNRYVKVVTENPNIPKSDRNGVHYGHIVGAISVVVKYIDKSTGEEIRTPKVVGNDMTDEKNIFVLNEKSSIEPETISGYAISSPVAFTPDKDKYVLELQYQPTTTPPIINLVKSPEVPQGTTEANLDEVLRSLVRATDLLGRDITDKLVIDKGALDPTQMGSYDVKYTVTDEYGNTISKVIKVAVGGDWLKYPIGGGWVLGDFTYVGSTLTGFSTQGLAKLNAMPAGHKDVILPSFSPNGDRPIITKIQTPTNNSNTTGFGGKNIDSVDFSAMENLEEIGVYSFRASGIKELKNFDKLVNLNTIGSQAFSNNSLTELSFNGLSNLTSIGVSAFQANPLTNLDFNGASSLENIGSSAFVSTKLTSLDFTGADNLKTIGASAFYRLPIESINLSNLSKLESIGDKAFESNKFTVLDLSGLTSLQSIGKEAFKDVPITDVNFANTRSLKTIGDSAFIGTKIKSLDFTDSVSLESIGKEAFKDLNTIEELIFGNSPNLKTIGDSAFAKINIQRLDLSTLTGLEKINAHSFENIYYLNTLILPKKQGDVEPKLKSIETYAFRTNRLTGVEIHDLPYLTEIKDHAFFDSSNLGTFKNLSLKNLPVLTTIAKNAFANRALSEVYFENLPKLEDIEQSAFSTNPGSEKYDNLVVIWYEPKDDVKLVSKSNYIVNPSDATGEFTPEDFTYATIDGKRTVTGFTPSGASKLINGDHILRIPAVDTEGTPIVGIGDSAFSGRQIASLDLSQMTDLEFIEQKAFSKNNIDRIIFPLNSRINSIGDFAFDNNKLKTVDFSRLRDLEQMGLRAFASNDIESLDLSSLDKLKSIPSMAFYNNPHKEIKFGNLPQLESIGAYAFTPQYKVTQVQALDLSGLTNLQTIGNYAFKSLKIEDLNITGLTNLTTIGSEAFQFNNIGAIDFTGLDALTTIGSFAFGNNTDLKSVNFGSIPNLEIIVSNAFANGSIESVNFGNLPKLRGIGEGAFSNNKIQSLDLSGLTSLTTISKNLFNNNEITDINFGDIPITIIHDDAFSNNKLTTVDLSKQDKLTNIATSFRKNNITNAKISDSVRALSNAFRENIPAGEENPRIVIVTTVSGTNPNKLANDISVAEKSGGHVIDPKKVIVNYVDEAGNVINPPSQDYDIRMDASSRTMFPKEIPGYKVLQDSIKIYYISGINEYEITFVYEEQDYTGLPTLGMKLDHTNRGNNNAKIGHVMITDVSLSVSSAFDDLENPEVKIYFDPTYIDMDKLKIPDLDGVYHIDIKEGVITLHFDKLHGADFYNIPIEWAFKENQTPQNYEMTIKTELRDSEGNILLVPLDDNGEPYYPTVKGYYNLPRFDKGSPGIGDSFGFNGGLRDAGNAELITIDEQLLQYITDAKPIPFRFSIAVWNYQNRFPNFERNLEKAIIEDTLPTYQAIENGQIVTKTAVFNKSRNQAWVYDETTNKVTYTRNIPNLNIADNLPTLYLEFPGAIVNQIIENKAEAILVPYDKPDYEDEMRFSSDVRITPIPSAIPIGGGTHRYFKSVNRTTFNDWPDEKEDVFIWTLKFTPNVEELSARTYYKNLVFNDNLLDKRMYFESIELNFDDIVAKVRAYDEADNLISEENTVDGKYTFNNPLDIYRIEVDYGETVISSQHEVKINTRLRDPENTHFDKLSSLKNRFRNSAIVRGEAYTVDGEKAYNIEIARSSETVIQEVSLTIQPTKSQTYPSSIQGANSVVTGDTGTYEVSVYRRNVLKQVLREKFLLPIYNFKMIDLMPVGMLIAEDGITLSPEFTLSPGAKVEVISDFKDGRTAIIFTADKLEADVVKVAKIDTIVDIRMDPGYHKNEVFMTYDHEDSQIKFGSRVNPIDFGDGREYMQAEQAFSLLKPDYMMARKYIRTVDENNKATGDWSMSGVVTKGNEKFQYMLLIDNNTDLLKTQNEIYDVLPYIGDKTIQINNAGERAERGSQFTDKLLGVDVQGKYASDFKVQYTSDLIDYSPQGVEASEYLKTLNWSDELPENATAFRVIPIDPQLGRIDPRDKLTIIVNMQAPEMTEALEGKTAHNSFIRTDKALTGRYLEANVVYNKMPLPRGEIKLRKISEAKDEAGNIVTIEGAVFTLINAKGELVARAISDENGLVHFTNIPIDDYQIVETSVPEGFTGSFTRSISRDEWYIENLKPEYIYNIGDVVNIPIYEAKLILEKLGSGGVPLQGVKFSLYKYNQGKEELIEQKTTDVEGRITFESLAKGSYVLKEVASLGQLNKLPDQKFSITRPDQIVDFTMEKALKNEHANVKLQKVGLLGELDPNTTLAFYSPASGFLLREEWTFEIYNVNTPDEKSTIKLNTNGEANIPNLKTGELYVIKEISGPEGTIYQVNPNEYKFMVNAKGQLVDENGRPFAYNTVYFPNEKKDVFGRVEIKKHDQYGELLGDVDFTLFRLNNVTNEYENTGITVRTDIDGKALFENISSGTYEIRETKVPEGYVGSTETMRFIVENTANANMKEPVYDNSDPNMIVHKFEYEVENIRLDLEFIKEFPVADNISEREADELIANNPEYIKRQNGAFYDVYMPIPGVTIDMYEIVDGVDKLIAEGLITDAEGKLDIKGIDGFVLKPDGVYKFVETKTQDDSWILNEEPIIIYVSDEISTPGFTGLVTAKMENYKKVGDILLSKYDRYTQNRLPGVTFTLYKGSLDEVLISEGVYDDSKIVEVKVTDENGFAHYKDLELGKYVLVETNTLYDQGYFLFEEPFEFEVTTKQTHFFQSVYNMQGKDYFEVPVQKIWIGEATNDPKGVVVVLKQNGVELERQTLNESNQWKIVFEKLLKRDNNMVPYEYTIEEIIPEGYESVTIGTIGEDGVITDLDGKEIEQITIKNYKLTDIEVSKKWDDLDNKYGLRPVNIQVQLIRNGENFGEPVTITADENGQWTYTFKDLYTHDENNVAYTYTIEEIAVNGYETSYSEDGLTIVNKSIETEVTATKVWEDFEDKYGLRPESITLQLLQNGVGLGNLVEVRPDEDGNWTYTFTELPKYDKDGVEFVYTIEEIAVNGYETSYSEDYLTVVNKLIETEVTANKVWEDFEDKYGLRPESITLQLLQNGNPLGESVEVKADEENNWTYTFTELPKYDKDGVEFVYTVEEIEVNGYETSYSEDGLTVVNKLITTEIKITKLWDDNNNKDKTRPEEISIQLYRDGKEFLDKVKLSDDGLGNWIYEFKDLPKLDVDGKEFVYTVKEIEVKGYEVSYSEDSFTITNKLVPVDPPKPPVKPPVSNPKTGDDFNQILLSVVFAISLFGIYVVDRRKRRI